jgi:hypothetical protein
MSASFIWLEGAPAVRAYVASRIARGGLTRPRGGCQRARAGTHYFSFFVSGGGASL